MLPYLRNVKHSKTMPRPSQLFVVISVNLRLLVAQNCLLKVIGSLMNELTTWKNINIPICKCQRYFLSLSLSLFFSLKLFWLLILFGESHLRSQEYKTGCKKVFMYSNKGFLQCK